jgi:hypothetical protein
MVRQQPVHARLCSFKEKGNRKLSSIPGNDLHAIFIHRSLHCLKLVDRRPIDPPPIVQLVCDSPGTDQQ